MRIFPLLRKFRRRKFKIKVKEGQEGEKIVFNYLESQGVKIYRFTHPNELTEKVLLNEIKRIFRDTHYLKVDAVVNFKGEIFFVDVKAKGGSWFWVDVPAYDNYFMISEVIPVFVYFYIRPLETIYRHKVINPQSFKRRLSKGKPVYVIPQNFIEQVT